MRKQVRLLVMSTLIMDEVELRDYAYRNSERAKDLSPDEFLDKLYAGKRVCVKFPDGTITTYEVIDDKLN